MSEHVHRWMLEGSKAAALGRCACGAVKTFAGMPLGNFNEWDATNYYSRSARHPVGHTVEVAQFNRYRNGDGWGISP